MEKYAKEARRELKEFQDKSAQMIKNVIPALENDKLQLINERGELMAKLTLLTEQMDRMNMVVNMDRKKFMELEEAHSKLVAEKEKNEARSKEERKYFEEIVGEKLRVEIELQTANEERVGLRERCATIEEQLKESAKSMNSMARQLSENSKAVHELGMQNQLLQIQLEEANMKLKPNWIDDHEVDNCMNGKCNKAFTTVVRKVSAHPMPFASITINSLPIFPAASLPQVWQHLLRRVLVEDGHRLGPPEASPRVRWMRQRSRTAKLVLLHLSLRVFVLFVFFEPG